MNVFEDLVLSLKEENLLETVVDCEEAVDITDEPNLAEPAEAVEEVTTYEVSEDEASEEAAGFEFVNNSIDEGVADEQAPRPAARRKLKHGREFFNKRAIAEVSSLQMVQHVLTGVEREYVKIVPKPFDDFNAKKALNSFLQISEDSKSEEHKQAEFDLMQETEHWCSALAERDRNIPVSSLRQYCENSRPALSSQALLSLGRFYRNSPYSESVRAKFDFVITRLFSRAGEDETRSCLFDREETLGHITTLYADWSAVPLYTADSDESNVALTALSFDDLAAEAETAANFDELITNDFFGRLRLFKESISELFYAPSVTAAAIECNIRIGNAYVKLIESEHAKSDASSIQSKYGGISGESLSDAAGWTLDLSEIIRAKTRPAVVEEAEPDVPQTVVEPERPAVAKAPPEPKKAPSALSAKLKASFKSVNRWVLIMAGVMVFLCAGLVIWVSFYGDEPVSTSGVRGFELETSPLNEHLKTAKVSGDTFYGLLQPTWDVLPKEKRLEFLQKAYAIAREQGCKQVNLVGRDGKVAAFASAARTEVVMP